MSRTETPGCLIAMKVPGEPEPAPIIEDLHCGPRRPHRPARYGGQSFLQLGAVERLANGKFIGNREL
ncbi:hypothetical protein [Paraburkholderia caribensis]|uniref:hypothetical protein n=1 Tax=Paraburkholderia caribensis TaxID=75105 RepID=UPI001D0686B6|nr:hypothetical protein [Paraburkholderia caribensis]